MSAESNKIQDSLVDQLSHFEARLDGKLDDIGMLADIQNGLGRMLGASAGNEAEVRRVLQERFESGNLRKETFQLVKSMLDRYVTEELPTSGPVIPHAPLRPARPHSDHSYVQTIADAARELESEDGPLRSTTVLPPANLQDPAAVEDRAQIGSVLRDRFLLQERVASGSMGVVYKALDRRLAEADALSPYVAVKVLSPQLAENGMALRALQQEAAKGRCLSHPNIVRFLDLDREDDLYFIVMEWLEGRTLAQILDSPDSSKLSQKDAFDIVLQIGKALSYAHRCGIVHADVKPANIMMMPNGDAKLFDFGVARIRQKQIEDKPDFDPGVLGLLTPAYSSMQVLTGENPTASDDVFSLACLLYRLIAGYRVFGPRNAAEAAAEGMKPQCPQGLSEVRWRALKKALSYSRVARFDSMDSFIAALDDGVDSSTEFLVPARPDLDLHDESHGPGRLIAGVVILLGLVGGAGYQFGLLDEFIERYAPVEFVENMFGAISDYAPTIEGEAPLPAALPAAESISSEELTDLAANSPAAGIDDPVVEPLPTENGVESSEVAAEAGDDESMDVQADFPFAEVDDADNGLSQETAPPLQDFSLLPRAAAELFIDLAAGRASAASVTLREDDASVAIDLVRDDVSAPLTLKLEEVGFSGNRSPWLSAEYEISNNGLIEFPTGQERARVTFSMRSDPLREADQQSTLRVRRVDVPSSELASITVKLEDDDQRAFEATLPPNTLGFAVNQISVSERDPAVQVDIQRFNPDETELIVTYELRDINATQGQDYFAPNSYIIEFGPHQRSARLLIPLVQDIEYEDNESFSVELASPDSSVQAGVYQRTAIIIRDDDS